MAKKILVGIAILAGVFAAVMLGCGKEEETPPTVPPAGVLHLDLSIFQSSTSLARATDSEPPCSSFAAAAGILVTWAILTEAIFFWPRVAFALAISRDPVYEGDKVWRWTFSYAGTSINLYGTLLADSVEWRMKITNTTLTDFLWYEGKCDHNAYGGWWKFYEPDSITHASRQILWVNWDRYEPDTLAALVIINIGSHTTGYGDTLGYGVDDSIATAWAHVLDGTYAGRWTITWNIYEHFGSIQIPSGATMCWDESLDCAGCDSVPIL